MVHVQIYKYTTLKRGMSTLLRIKEDEIGANLAAFIAYRRFFAMSEARAHYIAVSYQVLDNYLDGSQTRGKGQGVDGFYPCRIIIV